MKELRKDVRDLSLAVAKLESELAHEKETTRLVLDAYKNDITHIKENLAAKFDVLITRLDAKVVDFENRLRLPAATEEQASSDGDPPAKERVKQKKQTSGV